MKLKIAIIFILFFFTISCKSERQKRIEDAAEKIEEAADKVADAAEKMSDKIAEAVEKHADKIADAVDKSAFKDRNVKIVSVQQLKNLLPENLSGLERHNLEGEESKTLGFMVSHAEAGYYNNPAGEKIKAELTDMGDMSGILETGIAPWATSDFSNENDSGFDRTTRVSGFKAFEEFDKDINRGKISVIVAKRFLLELKSRDLPYKDLRKAAENINLSELAGLAEDNSIY